jgi:hypothetical protein
VHHRPRIRGGGVPRLCPLGSADDLRLRSDVALSRRRRLDRRHSRHCKKERRPRRSVPRESWQGVGSPARPPRGRRARLRGRHHGRRRLVLGVRDLVRDGAPRKNQISNGISNFFLSFFSGTKLRDTQCGLRRYPVRSTLALGARAHGYAFEAEVILRALGAGVPVVEHTVHVIYPPEETRVTHFDSVRDPMRIVGAVVRTLYDLSRSR